MHTRLNSQMRWCLPFGNQSKVTRSEKNILIQSNYLQTKQLFSFLRE